MNRPLAAAFLNQNVFNKMNTTPVSTADSTKTSSVTDCFVAKVEPYQSRYSEQIDQRILKREEGNIERTKQVKLSIRNFLEGKGCVDAFRNVH